MPSKPKVQLKDIGLDIGLAFAKHVYKTDYLHYASNWSSFASQCASLKNPAAAHWRDKFDTDAEHESDLEPEIKQSAQRIMTDNRLQDGGLEVAL